MMADLAIIFTASLLMVLGSWGTWPDPLIDWGTHLYMAWQVSAGTVLYRDLAHFNGPLSVHFSALLFYFFGVTQHLLWYANLTILAGIIVMLYVIVRHFAHRVSATACTLVFVVLFAFNRFTLHGNYNYVTPYSQEITHGVALTLAGLCCLIRYQRTGSAAPAALAGLIVGLLFLTKPEVFSGGCGAIGAGFAAQMWVKRSTRRHVGTIAGAFLSGVILPPLISVALLSKRMPVGLAIKGTLGSWPWVFDPRIRSMDYYRWAAGFDDIPGNLRTMAAWLDGYVLAVVPLAIGALLAGRALPRSSLMPTALALAPIAAFVAFSVPISWIGVGWVLTAVMLAAIALLVPLWRITRHKRHPECPQELDRYVLWFAFVVLGSGYLAKIALRPRIWHYGFVLGMPATMILVDALLRRIPEWLDRQRASGLMFQVVAIGIMTGVAASLLYHTASLQYTASNVVELGQAGDSFLGDGVLGPEVLASLNDISLLVRPNQTLAVVPQGPMINYLARRVNPTRFLTLTPAEIVSAGEDNVLADYRAHPPDFIVLARKLVTPHAMQLNGEEYGRQLFAWILLNYRPITGDFSKGPQLGLTLMEYTPNTQRP